MICKEKKNLQGWICHKLSYEAEGIYIYIYIHFEAIVRRQLWQAQHTKDMRISMEQLSTWREQKRPATSPTVKAFDRGWAQDNSSMFLRERRRIDAVPPQLRWLIQGNFAWLWRKNMIAESSQTLSYHNLNYTPWDKHLICFFFFFFLDLQISLEHSLPLSMSQREGEA